MDDDELARLVALCAAASPGPWRNDQWRDQVTNTAGEVLCHVHGGSADAAFVVASRTALPALLAEVRRLRAALHGTAHAPTEEA